MTEEIQKGPVEWSYLIPIVLIFASLFGLAWIHTQCTDLKISIHRIQTANKNLEADNRGLEIERASLKSPKRLRQLGESKLGLQRPDAEKTLIIDLRGFSIQGGIHEKNP